VIEVADWIGTVVFAISGAALGVERRLDLFGVLVLACVTALFGGITRDVLIGAVPPAAFASWQGIAVASVAGVLTFYARPLLDRVRQPVLLFDALGLALFAVTGTEKAVAHGIILPLAPILGMITGIAGGMLRDVLVMRLPIVLHTDIYALAALAGGVIVALGVWLHVPNAAALSAGALACVALRLLAIYRHWSLPGAWDEPPASR
jgi:uncharacterized membrane protein YeiH